MQNSEYQIRVSQLHIGVQSVLMNKIDPKKLFNSKWTAVKPKNKEKHFIISEIDFDEEGTVISCYLEAVMSKRAIPIDWQDLKDDSNWVHGWK